jgi:hypothetical protein
MTTLPHLERELLHAARRTTALRPSRRRKGVAAVIVAGLLAGGATATAQLVDPPWTVGKRIAPVPGPAVVRAVDARQQTLDVLRQPVTAATALPARLRANLSESPMAGENPSLGRKAVTTPFGYTFWVVPAAAGKICLFVNGGSGGCGPASTIDDGTFNGMAPCDGGGVVHYGMLPNDATDASLTLPDGAARAVTITNNVWAVQIPRDQPQPMSLTWSQRGTPRQAPIGALPPPAPGSTTSGC